MMTDTDQLLDLARRRMQNGQLDGAMDALRQLLSQDPDAAEAHAFLALCLLDKQRLHAAASEAKMALALDPGLETAHYALAHILIAKRQFRQAEEHVNRVLEMDPNDSDYYLLAANLRRLGRQQEQVLPLLEKALELNPESPRILSELSDYYAGIGDIDRAERYAQASLQREPENVNGLVSMGYVLLRRGKTDEAREHAIWALRQEPGSRAALHLMAGVKARKNPLMGLWWRYNVWMNDAGEVRSILILLVAFVIYRVVTMLLGDMNQKEAAVMIQYAWLGIVLYTFVAPTMFKKSLEKELAQVRLSSEY